MVDGEQRVRSSPSDVRRFDEGGEDARDEGEESSAEGRNQEVNDTDALECVDLAKRAATQRKHDPCETGEGDGDLGKSLE